MTVHFYFNPQYSVVIAVIVHGEELECYEARYFFKKKKRKGIKETDAVFHSLPPPFSPSYKHLQVPVCIYISDSHTIVELGGVVVIVGRKDGLGYS